MCKHNRISPAASAEVQEVRRELERLLGWLDALELHQAGAYLSMSIDSLDAIVRQELRTPGSGGTVQ